MYSIGSPSNSLKIFTDAPNYFHPGRSATFKIGINIIANFGEIHPEITEFYGLKSSVFGFEIFPDKIPIPKNNKTARPMLKTASLQAVTREFAFIVDNLLESEKVIQAAKSADKKLITDIMIYDIYEGKNIPEGKKSIAIKVTIQPNLESLTDKDLEQISSNIIEVIKTKLSGTLREV